jgi:glutamate/tyrosine decarboxylase-like PLP-dependent enzyme
MQSALWIDDSNNRRQVWEEVADQIEQFFAEVDGMPVAPKLDRNAVRRSVASFSFEHPGTPVDVLRQLVRAWKPHQVHTAHPAYFGLFNPAPSLMGIAGETMAAAINPQLAAWSHSPFAVEAERVLIAAFGEKFGFRVEADGCMTTGGAEANLTALLCALARRWPEVLDGGVQRLAAKPVLYVSPEGHHSFVKAARMAGLGSAAVRHMTVREDFTVDVPDLRKLITGDREQGLEPFLLVGTAGTTGAGMVDPLADLAGVAREGQLWFHVDAAWGGAAALVPERKHLLSGIEDADSITFDAHKSLSVPMGAGMFLTRDREALGRVFSVRTAYMPKDTADVQETADPYVHSVQWSRRFIGLKLFLTLATAGWSGYAATLRYQFEMGELLRRRLRENGWRIVNETELPVVCFTPEQGVWDLAKHQDIADAVVQSGRAWISSVMLGGQQPAVRACITNYRTRPEHIEQLMEALADARSRVNS